MQPSGMTTGESGRQESQEQSEVDHGDFEMVVSFASRELSLLKTLGGTMMRIRTGLAAAVTGSSFVCL